jgi:hypothetical protein
MEKLYIRIRPCSVIIIEWLDTMRLKKMYFNLDVDILRKTSLFQ